MSKWFPITMVKRKQLARRAVEEAGIRPNPHKLGKARKLIEEIVNEDMWKYIVDHGRYCTPKDDLIIEDVARRLQDA